MQFAKKTIAVKNATYVAAKKFSLAGTRTLTSASIHRCSARSNHQQSKQATWEQLQIINVLSWFVLYLKKMKM